MRWRPLCPPRGEELLLVVFGQDPMVLVINFSKDVLVGCASFVFEGIASKVLEPPCAQAL